jgi:predicted dehydrogenase
MAKLRLGLIGAGNRGVMSFANSMTKHHSADIEFTAFADPNQERAQAGADYVGIKPTIHKEVGDLVTDKNVDAVVVTTPDYLHEEHCLAALENGKHVLVDKPLAITGKGCLKVIEASKKADKVLYMGFNLRHDIVLRRMKDLVAAGELGDIFSVQAIEHYNGGRTYMSRWNRLKKLSGGLWIHKGSHDFDICNWIMGSARPVRVSCFGSNFVLNEKGLPFEVKDGVAPGPCCSTCAYNKTCPDVYNVSQDAYEDELQSVMNGMWGADVRNSDNYNKDLCMYLSDKDTHDQGIAIVEYTTGATVSHSEYFATPLSNRKYLIEGTKGHGEADLGACSFEIQPRWTKDKITHALKRPEGNHGGADPVMQAEFVRCVLKNERPSASGVDGVWSVAIGEACEISRAESRMVEIKEVLDVDSDLLKE